MDQLSTLNALCSVLGADIKETLRNIDPSFYEAEASKNVSNVTIERLALTIGRLRETKIERMQKVDNAIGTSLFLCFGHPLIARVNIGRFKILHLQCWNCGI